MTKENFLNGLSDYDLTRIAKFAAPTCTDATLVETWNEEGLGDVARFDIEERNGSHRGIMYGEYGVVLPRTFNPEAMQFEESKYLLPTSYNDFMWFLGVAVCNHGNTNKQGESYFDAVEKRIMGSISAGKNIPSNVGDISWYAMEMQKRFAMIRRVYDSCKDDIALLASLRDSVNVIRIIPDDTFEC